VTSSSDIGAIRSSGAADADPWFSVRGPGGVWGNANKPPMVTLPPTAANALSFPFGRGRLGLGFINAWNPGITSAIGVAGVAYCRYPPPPR
jgi:hypothetical protein